MGPGAKFDGANRGMNRGMGGGAGSGPNGQQLHRFGDGVGSFGTPPQDGTGNQYGQ